MSLCLPAFQPGTPLSLPQNGLCPSGSSESPLTLFPTFRLFVFLFPLRLSPAEIEVLVFLLIIHFSHKNVSSKREGTLSFVHHKVPSACTEQALCELSNDLIIFPLLEGQMEIGVQKCHLQCSANSCQQMAAENKVPDGWSPGEVHRFDFQVCVRVACTISCLLPLTSLQACTPQPDRRRPHPIVYNNSYH